MKKIFGFLACLGMIVILASCTANKKAENDSSKADAKTADSKVLVAYFSATGTTAREAEKIAEATGGTLYEIQPEEPYTDEDLDYENKKSRTTAEKENPDMRPAIKKGLDIAPYETIYLGFPIWWYKAPNVIYTFLDSYDFSGKTIVVFATSGSSTLQSSYEALTKAYPNLKFQEGQVYNASNKDNFSKWIESLKK